MKQEHEFSAGLLHGIPIALGYLSVSFGFGIMAVKDGLSVLISTLISLTNLTSAGQAAGIKVIAADGSLWEMALVQLTINIRYALMALSLSQKLDRKFSAPHRMLAAYGITDEIFAVCSARRRSVTPAYMYGIILISTAGWVLGTFLGAAAGNLLPAALTAALSIMLYGMFIAIIVPPARKERSILAVVLTAAALSIASTYFLKKLSAGMNVIVCGLIAAAAGALLFPREEDDAE